MNDQEAAIPRYAIALYRAAEKAGHLDNVDRDLRELCDVLKPSGLLRYFDNSRYSYEHNVKMLDRLEPMFASRLSVSFLRLLLKKSRIAIIFGVARYFQDMRRRAQGIVAAEVTVSGKPNAAFLQKMQASLEKLTKHKVELHVKTNPNIIGGISIRIGNKLIDASVRTRLDTLKKTLLETKIN